MSDEEVAEAEEVKEAEAEEPQETQENAVEATEAEPQDNPLFKALFDAADDEPEEEETEEVIPATLNETLHDIEHPEQAIKAPDPAEVEPEAEEPAEEPKESKPKKKGKKVKQVVDPEVPIEEPAFQQEEEDPNKEAVEALLPEEREFYDMAKFANENMEGYDGLDGKFLDYFKKSKQYVDKRLADDPFVELGEDEEYRKFIKDNRPDFTPQDAKKVEQEMFIAKAEERALEKMRPEVERLRREQELAQKKPQVAKKKNDFRAKSQHIIPEDFRKQLSDGGEEAVKALQESNPLEFQLMDQVSSNLLTLADTFMDVTSGMVPYDEANTTHKQLLEWVQKEQDTYIQGGDTKKDGKTFMRRERYYSLPEDKRTEYFTWTDDDLLGIMTVRAKQQLDAMLEHQRKMLEQAGYVRGAQPQQPQQVAPVQQAPRVAPTPREGGTPSKGAGKAPVTPMSILGM